MDKTDSSDLYRAFGSFGEFLRRAIQRICDCKSERGRLMAENGVVVERRKIIPMTLFGVEERALGLAKASLTGAHTNSIEGTWSAIKNGLHKVHVKGQFDFYLAEYIWRRSNGHTMVDANFHDYPASIARVYPSPEKDDPQEYDISSLCPSGSVSRFHTTRPGSVPGWARSTHSSLQWVHK
ncbi:hypothetical protein TNCV_1057561 [Trichonephila clavipes]|nr:hypothetical protein TNCV_1057561 [Trichonephila clavipes]